MDGKERPYYVPAQFPTTTEACTTEITNDEGDGTLGVKATKAFTDVPIFNNLM